MKKLLVLLLSVLLVMGLLAGCGAEGAETKTKDEQENVEQENVEKAKINITAIAGPTGVGLVDLMQKQADGKAANEYTFNVVSAPDQAVAAVVNGSADIAAVPTINLISQSALSGLPSS